MFELVVLGDVVVLVVLGDVVVLVVLGEVAVLVDVVRFDILLGCGGWVHCVVFTFYIIFL